MTLNQRIIQALTPLGLPVVPDVDTLRRERCFVFYYDEAPTLFCDNVPWLFTFQIQVHLFLPLGENGLELVERAAQALTASGLSCPDVVDATDENGQHKVLECEAQAMRGEEGYVWLP